MTPGVGRRPWEVSFEQFAQRATLEDYLAELDHQAQRIARLDRAIDEAIEEAPAAMREVVRALQALRGVRKFIAVTIVAELGQLSRFPSARQLMGYSGAVPCEPSSGVHTWRGGITKTGNAHLAGCWWKPLGLNAMPLPCRASYAHASRA